MPPKKAKLVHNALSTLTAEQIEESKRYFTQSSSEIKKQIIRYCAPEWVMYLSKTLYLEFLSVDSLIANNIWEYWTYRDCRPLKSDSVAAFDLAKPLPHITAETLQSLNLQAVEMNAALAAYNSIQARLIELVQLMTELKTGQRFDFAKSTTLRTKIIAIIPSLTNVIRQYSYIPSSEVLNQVFWGLISAAFDLEMDLVRLNNLKPENRIPWKTVYLRMRSARDELLTSKMTTFRLGNGGAFSDCQEWISLVFPNSSANISLTGVATLSSNLPVNLEKQVHGMLLRLKRSLKTTDPINEANRIVIREILTTHVLPNLPLQTTCVLLLLAKNTLSFAQTDILSSRLTKNTLTICKQRLWTLCCIARQFDENFTSISCGDLDRVLKSFPEAAFEGFLFKFIRTFFNKEPLGSSAEDARELKIIRSQNIDALSALDYLLENHEAILSDIYRVVDNKTLFEFADELKLPNLMSSLFERMDMHRLHAVWNQTKTQPFSHWMLMLLRRYPLLSETTERQFHYLLALNDSELSKIGPMTGSIMNVYRNGMLDSQTHLNKNHVIHNSRLISILYNLMSRIPENYIMEPLLGKEKLFRLAIYETPMLLMRPLLDYVHCQSLSFNQKRGLMEVITSNIDKFIVRMERYQMTNDVIQKFPGIFDVDFILEILLAEMRSRSWRLVSDCWDALLKCILPIDKIRLAYFIGDWAYIQLARTQQTFQLKRSEFLAFASRPSQVTGQTFCHSAANSTVALKQLRRHFHSMQDYQSVMSILDRDGNSAFHIAAMKLAAQEFQDLVDYFSLGAGFKEIVLLKNHSQLSVMDIICMRFTVIQLSSLLLILPQDIKNSVVEETPALRLFGMNFRPQPPRFLLASPEAATHLGQGFFSNTQARQLSNNDDTDDLLLNTNQLMLMSPTHQTRGY